MLAKYTEVGRVYRIKVILVFCKINRLCRPPTQSKDRMRVYTKRKVSASQKLIGLSPRIPTFAPLLAPILPSSLSHLTP